MIKSNLACSVHVLLKEDLRHADLLILEVQYYNVSVRYHVPVYQLHAYTMSYYVYILHGSVYTCISLGTTACMVDSIHV